MTDLQLACKTSLEHPIIQQMKKIPATKQNKQANKNTKEQKEKKKSKRNNKTHNDEKSH